MSVIDKRPIVYIPIKNLSVVWAQAQRPYNPKWAKEIADEFDPDKFDPLLVTQPNGEGIYHIIEGQHRRHALEMFAAKSNPATADNEQAPCRVLDDVNPARAAELWLGVNEGRKSVRPIQSFLISVHAKREPHLTINKMVLRNGYKIANYKESNCITAVTALLTVYNRYDELTLSRVLSVLRLMWDGDPHSVSSPMLRGFARFLNEFGLHINNKRLIKLGQQFSPYKVWQAADARKESALQRIDEAISEMLYREYNKNLSDEHKLKRKS